MALALILIRPIVRERPYKRNVLTDEALDFESMVNRKKKELSDYFEKEKYNYSSGFVPGAEPELSYIDPLRGTDPVEVVTATETYAPTVEPLTETCSASEGKTYPSRSAAKISTPLKVNEGTVVAPPVLTAEMDPSAIKMPKTVLSSPDIKIPPRANGSLGSPEMPRQKQGVVKPVIVERVLERTVTEPVMVEVTKEVIKEVAKEVPAAPTKEEPKAPAIAYSASVKKVERANEMPKDTHRIVITAVPVLNPKPQHKGTKKEFKVSVEKPSVDL